MNRRKFLNYTGCGCLGVMINGCSTAPITDRRQLKIIPEAKLNAQAAQIYEKVKEKEKMSDDTKSLNEIKDIGKKMEESISEYFYRAGLVDPTTNFDWEYILIDNKKIKNAWCMPGGKIAIYTGMLDITKNKNGLASVMGHEIAHAVAKHSVERASRGMLLNTSTRLIDIISDASSKADLRVAVRALDRVLRAEKFWIPQWYKDVHTVAYFDMFEHPEPLPPYSLGYLDFWWVNPEKEAKLKSEGAL